MGRKELTLAALLFISLSVVAQDRIVQGTVVDAAGNPAATATVSAWPFAVESLAGSVHWIATDATGHFQMVLKPGRYVLRAKSFASRYPDPSYLLSHDPAVPTSEITVGESDLHGVTVQLGRKGALLKGDVKARDGSVIPHSRVIITDAVDARAKVILTTDEKGRFEFLVPSKPLLIEAGAKGFATVVYNGGAPVTPRPGEELDIHVVITSR